MASANDNQPLADANKSQEHYTPRHSISTPNADKAAGNALIPEELWSKHPARKFARLEDVFDLAKKADVHHSIVAGRIRYEKQNYRLLARQVGNRQVKKRFNQ